MFLLDTDIVWQLRGATAADPALTAWVARQQRTGLFVSALTLVELGIAADGMARADKQAGAAVRLWAESRVVSAFEGRVLAVDARVAGRAARLGHPNLTDGLIAATALEHGLVLATRTPAAFRATKAKLLDPGSSAASDADGSQDADWRQASRGGPVWLRNLFARG